MSKVKMRVSLAELEPSTTATESFDEHDVDTAARLMVDSYRGTTDWDDGDDEIVAAEEIRNTLNGEYGDFVAGASRQLRRDGTVVSQIVCTIFDGSPLIVFVYTHPDHKGNGHATNLIRAAAEQLRALGFDELTLFVTSSSPARTLYEKLGFVSV